MQAFIRHYINTYAQTSITTENLRFTWEMFVEDNFSDPEIVKIFEAAVDWETWITKPGMPPFNLDFSTDESSEAIVLADLYIKLNGTHPDQFLNFDHYYSNLKVIFLERLLIQEKDVSNATMIQIDKDYDLTHTLDPEIKQRWFALGIKRGYYPVVEQAFKFVSEQGRMKYLNPIYLALLATD